MINRLESFCPYLDNDFFDYCMSLPLDARTGRVMRSKILCRAYPELFSADSSLLAVNALRFKESHDEYYRQRVKNISQISKSLLLNLRTDVFNPAYLLPRIGRDIFASRLYALCRGAEKRQVQYRKCHHDLLPQIYTLNKWLIREKI
jgi:hypothetical protein